MQIKAPVRYNHILNKIAKVKGHDGKIKLVQARIWSNWKAHTLLVVCQLPQLFWKTIWQSPLKLYICMSPAPADPLPGKCQQKCIRYVHLKAWIKMFIATFLCENYAKAHQWLKKNVDEQNICTVGYHRLQEAVGICKINYTLQHG